MVLLPLAVMPIALPPPRLPTASERREISAAARRAYEYETYPGRPKLHPKVVSIRVSRSNRRFATALVEQRDRRGQSRRGRVVVLFRRVKEAWEPVEVSGTTIPLGCTKATPQPVRELICPDPWSILGHAPPRIRLNTSVTQRVRAPDLRSVDWGNISVPGAVCGSTRSIRLHRGRAFVRSAAWPWWPAVEVSSGPGGVFYGDLDGDGRDEAAVSVICSNGGGTAGGQLAFASVVFTHRAGRMRTIGIITPRQPLSPEPIHVPLVGAANMKIRRGVIVAVEAWYGSGDGTCCPSGRARTTWEYKGGRLRPVRTLVLR